MKTKVLPSVFVVVLLLVLAGSMGLSRAQGPEQEDQVGTEGAMSVAAYISPMISYQGVLSENGVPVSGTRSMTFLLYDTETGGTPIWEEGPKSVDVSNGLFNVILGDTTALDVNDFDQDLWLEVEVEGTALPRQRLMGAPYAFSLVPGADVTGLKDDGGSILYVRNEGSGSGVYGSSASGVGVYGFSASTTDGDAAVYGQSNADSGYVSGVYGETSSANGSGVTGEATTTTGNVFGVRGLTTSSQGTGVYGWAGSYNGTGGYPYGVRGYSQSGHGVYGSTNGDWNWISGVYGLATKDHANGVTGWNSGGGVGVYAWSTSGTAIVAKGGGSVLMGVYESTTDDLRFRVDSDGEVYADGSFHSGGADMAEMLPTTEDLEPGDVLVVGPDGLLLRSDIPYDSKVVGVYSTRPGFTAGSGGEADDTDNIPLAVVGIVPVKACAENGPISPGDLLVTSSTPGHAMKAASDPPVGTVIGKALEGLDADCGVIKMLVMLQ